MAFEGIRTVLSAFRSHRAAPTGVYELAQKAKTLLEQGETEAACQVLKDALERFPGHSSLGDINHFLGQRRLQEGLSELRRVLEETRRAYVRAARAFAETDNTQKAIDFVTGAFRRFPECPDLHLVLGEIYLRRYLEDRIPEDGRWASQSLERACRLDPANRLPRKYLAGFYARIGCFRRATEFLSALDVKGADEEEKRYIRELHGYCSRRADTHEEDIDRCLTQVWESGVFAVDCRDWAMPDPPAFGRRDLKSVLVPLAVMEATARKWLELPGVKAVVVQNEVRSKTLQSDDTDGDAVGLERVVREVVDKSEEACHHMGLGHVRRCDLRTTTGALSLHTFADTWAGVQFDADSSTAQVRTVAQQCLDLMAECMGEIHESHSRKP